MHTIISHASSTLLCEHATYKDIIDLHCVHGVECPANFTHIASVNGCYKLVTSNLEWSVAGLECRRLHKDAHLVVINDAEENLAVTGMLASTSRQCFFITFWRRCEFYISRLLQCIGPNFYMRSAMHTDVMWRIQCKGVRCPPIFSLSNLINTGWLVRKCVNIYIRSRVVTSSC